MNYAVDFHDAMAGSGRAGSSGGRRYMTSDGNSEETDDDEAEGALLSGNSNLATRRKAAGKKSDPAAAAADMFVIDFGGGELPSVAAAAAQKGPDGLASRFRRREAAAARGSGPRAVSLGRDQARGRHRAKRPALPSSPSKRSSSSLSPAKSSVTSAASWKQPPSHSLQKRRLVNKTKSGSSPSGKSHVSDRLPSSGCHRRGNPHFPQKSSLRRIRIGIGKLPPIFPIVDDPLCGFRRRRLPKRSDGLI